MATGKSFAERLMEIFLTGFGIATGVSLFIFPMTSRTIVSGQMGAFVALLKGALNAHGRYMRSISKGNEMTDNQDGSLTDGNVGSARATEENGARKRRDKKGNFQSEMSAEATAMKKALFDVGTLFGKIHLELGFAKRELAYGKLCPDDFKQISLLLRNIMLPIVGMTTFIDILESVKNRKLSERTLLDSEGTVEAIEKIQTEEWEEVMAIYHDPFQKLNEAMQDGLIHISQILELTKPPKKAAPDPEKPPEHPAPGEHGFAAFLEDKIRRFETHRARTLKAWCDRKGIDLPATFWNDPTQHYSLKDDTASAYFRQKESQQQLQLVLYVEYLTYSIGQSILEMVRYSDSKIADGTMAKKRVIFPGWKRIHKWIRGVFEPKDTDGTEDGEMGRANVWIGDSLKAKKDPEHLPPNTFVQKSTNYLRVIPRFLSSPESSW
jgi:Putative ER transporter, 6TM, N-terminal